MAAAVGRTLQIAIDGTPDVVINAQMREKSLTIDGSPIDITTDGDDGKRTLLEASGQEQIDISVSGVIKDKTLRRIAHGASGTTRINPMTITYEDGDAIEGDFRLNNYVETAPYNDAMTFTATLQSTGAWVYIEDES